MTRILWISGLSLSLLVFGGWTILILIAAITHRHLNQKGLLMLVCDAYITWITFNYLRQKLRDHRSDQ
jgi:NADH:ubiquinone oxidoreductase subunit H